MLDITFMTLLDSLGIDDNDKTLGADTNTKLLEEDWTVRAWSTDTFRCCLH